MIKKSLTKKEEGENKVKTEKLPNSRVKLNVVVGADKFKRAIDEAVKSLSEQVKVDGFRKGKVPRAVIENQLGSESILNEGAQKVIQKEYVNVILDNKIEAVGKPEIEIIKIAEGSDLEFTAVVDVLPEVVLGKWEADAKKINKKHKKIDVEVDDKEVEREVKYLAKERAKVVTVNRVAKKGDQVEIDFEVLKDGVPIENGTAKKHAMIIGEGRFIPGFEEKLVDKKAGDEFEFELSFPEDYHAKNLAGQKCGFKVKVNIVQERKIPEIDDKFASSIGKFKSLKELKDNIQEGIRQEASQRNIEKHERELIEKVIEFADFELPTSLVDREIQIMTEELMTDITRLGLTKEAYFTQIKTTEDELKRNWEKKSAPARVKAALILRDFAKKEKIKPETKEIEGQVNQVLQQYAMMGKDSKDLNVQQIFETAKGQLTNKRVLEWLTSL